MTLQQIAKDMNEKTGKTGNELKELVYGVAYMMAAMTNNEAAMDHFNEQYANIVL